MLVARALLLQQLGGRDEYVPGPALQAPVHLGGATGGTTPLNSATVNVPAGSRLWATLAARNSTGSLPNPFTISDDKSGQTWQAAFSTLYDTSDNPRLRQGLWYIDTVGALTALTASVACTNAEAVCIELFHTPIPGTITTNKNTVTDTAGDPHPVLPSTPRNSSLVLGTFVYYGGAVTAAPTGFTQVGQNTYNSGVLRQQTVYALTNAPQEAAWATGGSRCLATLLEVRQ